MRIAAIDIGTNSIHLIVCDVRPDLSFEVIDAEKDMVRLGTGGLEGRRLDRAHAEAAMQTLRKFKSLAESHKVDEVIAAATSAVREARDGSEFIAAVRRDTAIRARVISGTEEARLIHLGATYAIGTGKDPAVVLDIGGGSAEVTLGPEGRPDLGKSFKIGVIRMTERFAKNDPWSDADERQLVKRIRRDVGAHVAEIAKRGFERVIGCSGTILALGAMAGDSKGSSDVRRRKVSASDLHRIRKSLVAASLKERQAMPRLDPKRVDQIVAGAILLDTLLEDLGATELTLCDFALREGLVIDYVSKNAAHIRKVDHYPDARRRSVIELGERCNYRAPHAEHVARLAVALFDAFRAEHGLGETEREWLEYAGLLHDVGLLISYEPHHKHSYYLIKHGELRGFDPEEVEIIALLARYHRQATPRKSHRGFGDLGRNKRQAVRVLAALLRLAEGLDRSHNQVVAGIDAEQNRKGWAITLHAAGDAELEAWVARRHAVPLEEILGREIRFVVSR